MEVLSDVFFRSNRSSCRANVERLRKAIKCVLQTGKPDGVRVPIRDSFERPGSEREALYSHSQSEYLP